ncbi:hypothetical protein Tco_0793275 [Tanacetum coccineum]
MDDPDITMEEYIQLEEEKSCRRGQEFNWETVTYGKIRYDEDVHFLRYVEMEFPAIVYNDALTSELELSCEPMIFNVDDLKLDMDNGDDEIDIIQSLGDLSIEPLLNVINTDVGAYAQGSNKLLETSHDTSSVNTVYPGFGIRHIDFLTLLNENDDFREVFIFWNSVCCSRAGIQTYLQHMILLINATWRIISRKSQGSFSF